MIISRKVDVFSLDTVSCSYLVRLPAVPVPNKQLFPYTQAWKVYLPSKQLLVIQKGM